MECNIIKLKYNHHQTKNYNQLLALPGVKSKYKSKYKYNELRNSERVNKWLLTQEYLMLVIKTCCSKASSNLSIDQM